MTNRIFATLKSRLPDGARAESKDAVDAIASVVAESFKKGAGQIATDGRYTDGGKRDALAALRKSTLEAGRLAELRSSYAAKLANISGEQDAMRRTALNGPDGADVGATLRREMRDSEMRALLRGMPLHERLAAVQSDSDVARGRRRFVANVIRAAKGRSSKPSSPTSPIAPSRPNLATGPSSLPPTPRRLKRSPGAIDVAVGLVERE